MKRTLATFLRFVLLAALLAGQTGCVDLPNNISVTEVPIPESDGLMPQNLQFSPDYKTLYLNVNETKDLEGYALDNPAEIRAEVSQDVYGFLLHPDKKRPALKEIRHVGSQQIAALGLKLLVVVDLTLPQNEVNRQRSYIETMHNVYRDDNLFVAFMADGTVSPFMPVTNYIISHYFVSRPDTPKRLYRSLIGKVNELTNDSTSFLKQAHYRSMIVFSDGEVYRNDEPIDPDHYSQQQRLLQLSEQLANRYPVYYVNLRSAPFGESEDESENILSLACRNLGGAYLDRFDWISLERQMLSKLHISYSDYQIVLENPSRKVYRGSRHDLTISFYDCTNDSLVASASTSYSVGSIYQPIIIDGLTMRQSLLQGCLWGVILMLLTYAGFQFVWPYVHYRLFRRRYVVTYQGSGMSVNNRLLDRRCYFCKDEFKEGDLIVTRCEHVVHLQCWEENGYHCPEYGRQCKEGSHYYNRHHLLDPKNASFLLKWVLAAILAAICSWVYFNSLPVEATQDILGRLLLSVTGLEENSERYNEFLHNYEIRMGQLPTMGLSIGGFLTFALSLLTSRHRKSWKTAAAIAVRTLVAGVGGYVSFLLTYAICAVCDIPANSLFVSWIPWSLTAYITTLCSTVFTGTQIRTRWVAVAIGIGLFCMYLWAFLFVNSVVNYRESLLFSYILYAVGIAVSIARVSPRSEHYFLHVSGAIKPTDIALYKWLQATPDAAVTIGKGVDCRLQLSWDVSEHIAPLQAEIFLHRGSVCLRALEAGVLLRGKDLAPGTIVPLYHGRKFRIGNTLFTYIEKDMLN